jgi:SAM-dependent methyltransferase
MTATPVTPLEEFVRNHMHDVQGWAGTADSLMLHAELLAVQEACDGLGAFEIGVHHGRYLIALHNACEEGSRSLGIDLFDDQASNVDASGAGNQPKARQNLDEHAREPALVELMARDSLTMSDADVADIVDRFGGFRIASVDGGHTAFHAASDIRLAARVVSPGGLISVDDFFHPNFPGVTEGVYAVLEGRQTPFIPWLATRKKLFLAHISFAGRYRTAVMPRLAASGHRPKAVTIAGEPCLSLYI